MAKSIEFEPRKYDPRTELFHRLENAPEEYVEAILDAYEVLQLLRDKGILEILKGALGSGEKILGEVTKTIETAEAISLVRNLTTLVKLLGGLNPKLFEEVEHTLTQNIREADHKKTPGLWKLWKRLSSHGTRRFAGTALSVMNTLGEHLSRATEPGLRGEKRKKTTRHWVGTPPTIRVHKSHQAAL
jgi:uncharacterized protein YjgD (DUF1641 family)